MPAKLRIRAGPAGKQVAQVVVWNLSEEARGAIQNDTNASSQLLGGKVLDRAEIDADQFGDALERLAVHPFLAARYYRQLSRSERQQFIERAFIGQDVARLKRNFMFAKELLSAQTAGSARLPVDPNGFLGRWNLARHLVSAYQLS